MTGRHRYIAITPGHGDVLGLIIGRYDTWAEAQAAADRDGISAVVTVPRRCGDCVSFAGGCQLWHGVDKTAKDEACNQGRVE